MKHILIDARESGTTTGRYIDKLIEHLHALIPGVPSADQQTPDQQTPGQQQDTPGASKDSYAVTLLAKPHRLEYLSKIAPSFKIEACPHKEFTFAEQIGLKGQIERLKPNLVHFPAVQQPVWLDRDIRVVTTMQDLTTLRFKNPAKNALAFAAKQQVYRWVNQRVAHKSDALITPTEFVKQDIVKFSGVSPDKITVTLESADDLPTPAKPVDGLDSKDFIMYVGRATPHKNLERLVEAFGSLHDKHPELHLVFVGKKDANSERIEAIAAKQGIANVVFTGFVSDNQLRWLYGHTQAYVFPSLSEGFGLPPLEAMRHGAPVVSSNATCLPEVNGDAALYFDPLSVQDMAGKIDTILSDENLRQEFIAKGRRQAAKYSWRRMAEQTLTVYKATLSR